MLLSPWFLSTLNSAVGLDHYLTDCPTPMFSLLWVRLGVPQLVIGFFFFCLVGAEIEAHILFEVAVTEIGVEN